MKITAIKRQVRRPGRFSIFLDGEYSFSLGEEALLDTKLTLNQDVTVEQVKELKQIAENDKLYANTLNYLAIRQRSEWEITSYLQRKSASPSLVQDILNKLSNIGLIDDTRFAEAFVASRLSSRPTSRRKLQLELQKRRIAKGIIDEVLQDEAQDDTPALLELIVKKRQQTRYQDDQKLMQYLVRQGFSYGDVKSTLATLKD